MSGKFDIHCFLASLKQDSFLRWSVGLSPMVFSSLFKNVVIFTIASLQERIIYIETCIKRYTSVKAPEAHLLFLRTVKFYFLIAQVLNNTWEIC